tara:strand:- start:368 stop:1717 length:1350 start_codon:yes stop_codon:yes gene_type:complete
MASTYLYRTSGTATSTQKFTVSAWVKQCLNPSGATDQAIWGVGSSNTNLTYLRLRSADNSLQLYIEAGGSEISNYVTNRLLRDVNGWYHIVLAVDTTQSTAANRVKIYVNGVQETSFSSSVVPSVNHSVAYLSSNLVNIGRRPHANNNYFDGYQSHVSFVDGQALAPTVFGQTDSTSGIWKFKSPSGVTWGDNGFHLKMENSGNLGLDSSGETNNFTLGGNGRQALDTPSNVYATWNPLSSKVLGTVDWTLKDGNTNFDPGSNTAQFTMGTLCPAAGKWYWEMKSVQGSATDWPDLGIMFTDSISTHMSLSTNPQHNFSYTVSLESNGTRWVTGTATGGWVSGYANGDIIMIAVDVDAGKLWWGKNGSWFESANPASGNQAHATWTAGTSITPWIEQYNVGEVQANFGNGYFGTTAISSAGSNGNGSLFEYDVPSGYYALNTKNINTYG